MELILAARKSDLARLQAFLVGDVLKAAFPELKIQYKFRESLGDRHLEDPLWKMPERGVFTEDFYADLVEGRCDMVVHSWKDLPLAERPDTMIAATLPRADMRDVLLVKKSAWESAKDRGEFRVLSSSPRRSYNLTPFLEKALPFAFKKIEFAPVRGNVQTRLRKLLESTEAHGLVVAKAALDRLLLSREEELQETREFIRGALNEALRFMVLPLKENPTAAAQGALAIEIKKDNEKLRQLLLKINCEATFAQCSKEREVLGLYGGGCHQKIGVSVIEQPFGRVFSLKGLSDAGELLNKWTLLERPIGNALPAAKVWPSHAKERAVFFERRRTEAVFPAFEKAFWLAKAEAWPTDWPTETDAFIWTAGLESWFQLALRGLWVHGSSEGLGEDWDPNLETLAGAKLDFLKLSHDKTPERSRRCLATYSLVPIQDPQVDFSGREYFFWMSGSQFERALEIDPSLRSAKHACGPGNTYKTLREYLGAEAYIEVFLSFDDWLKSRISSEAR